MTDRGRVSSLENSLLRRSRTVRYARLDSSTLPHHTSTPDAVTHAVMMTQYRVIISKSVPPNAT